MDQDPMDKRPKNEKLFLKIEIFEAAAGTPLLLGDDKPVPGADEYRYRVLVTAQNGNATSHKYFKTLEKASKFIKKRVEAGTAFDSH